MNTKTHIFFDLDRTLWDFDTNSKKALEAIYYNHKIDTVSKSFESFYNAYVKVNAKLWTQYGKGKLAKDTLRYKRFDDTLKQFQIFDQTLAKEIGEEYVATSPYQTAIFPNTHEMLKELKDMGYDLHIITNGFKEIQHIKLSKTDLADYFDVVVCSEVVGVNKPDFKVFEYAAQQAKADLRKSIMIGDDFQVDVIGAEKAGMRGVLFDAKKKYKEGTHEFQINDLGEFPSMVPWIEKTF